MLSYAGKRSYDDVEKDRIPAQSHCEKCVYDDVEADRTPVRSPVEKCIFPGEYKKSPPELRESSASIEGKSD
jgi:hypothetical protein